VAINRALFQKITDSFRSVINFHRLPACALGA
jgi:hypothetical protein